MPSAFNSLPILPPCLRITTKGRKDRGSAYTRALFHIFRVSSSNPHAYRRRACRASSPSDIMPSASLLVLLAIGGGQFQSPWMIFFDGLAAISLPLIGRPPDPVSDLAYAKIIRGPPIVYRVKIIIIVDIHVMGQPNLMLVASAFHLLRLGPCEGRQQQASQDRNNRNHHQQLNQRKRRG